MGVPLRDDDIIEAPVGSIGKDIGEKPMDTYGRERLQILGLGQGVCTTLRRPGRIIEAPFWNTRRKI